MNKRITHRLLPSKRLSNIRLGLLLNLAVGALFVAVAVTVVILVNHHVRQQALNEAESKARLLLDRNLATHTYFSHDLKPNLFEWTEPFRADDYFDPTWMSSTYAIRKIDACFKSLNPADYYYKECAINARSPENEADAYERGFLEELNANPELTEHSLVRVLDGEPYFVTLRRGEVMEESCLRCHGAPDQAPEGLIDHYGAERSFNRQVGDVVSAISIRVPLSAAYANADRFSLRLSGLLLVVLVGLFITQVWIGKRMLLAPLARIRDKALQISASSEHLGEQICLPVGKELQELTRAFNAMSIDLRRSRDQLEERVKERTAELGAANRQLEREIAERRRAEEKLREYSERLEEMVEERTQELQEAQQGVAETLEFNQRIITASPLGITAYQASGNCVLANEAAAKIIGATRKQVLQQNFYQLESWMSSSLLEAAKKALASGSETRKEVHVVSTFGKDIWIDCRFVPFTLSGESHLLLLTDDITEQQELQARLVRSEKLAVLGKLAGGVGHDLRTPLGAIKNATYFLNMVGQTGFGIEEPDPEVKETLEILEREVGTCEKIISSLLDFARAKPPVRRKVDVNEVVRATLSRIDAPENVEVVSQLEETLPIVLADPDQLVQVFSNLVRNAIQAMPEGGRLTVKTWQEEEAKGAEEPDVPSVPSGPPAPSGSLGSSVRVSIADTGEGIPVENLGKVFEPLFTTKAKGIGLGLAVVKTLVEGHEGTVEVESAEGKGSTFTVKLPISGGENK